MDDPAQALLQVVPVLCPSRRPRGASTRRPRIGTGATWQGEVWIGPNAVLGRGRPARRALPDRARGGAGGRGRPSGTTWTSALTWCATAGSRLGHRVRLKAGAVIGGDGFGFASGPDGHRLIRHVGGCIIEDDVEIGSNTCIDRGSLDDTVIGAGTKIDNLVHLAHNVRVGRGCLIMARVGVAGSARIGNGVILAGQVGVVGHITLGDGVRMSAQSGVGQDVPAAHRHGRIAGAAPAGLSPGAVGPVPAGPDHQPARRPGVQAR